MKGRGSLFFLEINPGFGSKDYSEETAREIDNEVKRIIDVSYLRVKARLTEKRDLLEKIAQTLLEKETIEGEELRQIIKEDTEKHDTEQPGKEAD